MEDPTLDDSTPDFGFPRGSPPPSPPNSQIVIEQKDVSIVIPEIESVDGLEAKLASEDIQNYLSSVKHCLAPGDATDVRNILDKLIDVGQTDFSVLQRTLTHFI